MSIAGPATTFLDLHVWQRSHRLALQIYTLTASFPKHELFGLTSQMRRAAVSVPANIAEGFRRRGKSDKARLLNIAAASLEELRYYLILATDLKLGASADLARELDEISRMLSSYERTILASTRMGTLRVLFLTFFCLLYSVF